MRRKRLPWYVLSRRVARYSALILGIQWGNQWGKLAPVVERCQRGQSTSKVNGMVTPLGLFINHLFSISDPLFFDRITEEGLPLESY